MKSKFNILWIMILFMATQTRAQDCSTITLSLSTAQNFVLTSIPRVSGLTDPSMLTGLSTCSIMQTVQYSDGLGRPLQTVQVKGSAAGHDVVQPFAYDAYGREVTKYLPYAITSGSSDGSYKSAAISTDQPAFYSSPPSGVSSNSYPTANISFEPSPLNRPVEQGAPGATWQLGSGHTVTSAYNVNVASDIPMWVVTSGGASWGSTYYSAGTLTITVTTDENGNDVIAYTDMFNRVIAKKVDNSGTYLLTSYVYDDYGNLAYVIPPVPTTYPTSFGESDAVFNNFIYAYRYDTRNRVIRKKIPGKGWDHMVYNTIDQVVASQDSVQRNNSEWIFTKYDGSGRVVEMGVWGSGTSRASLQSTIDGYTTNLWETANGGSGNGYSNAAWPTSSTTALTFNYYDSYANAPSLPYGPWNSGTMAAPTGLPVASLTSVLNPDGSISSTSGLSHMLWTASFYDTLGRVVQISKQHYLGGSGSLGTGNYENTINTYNFDNQVYTTTRWHIVSNSVVLTVANVYYYDHMGRRVQNWQEINSDPTVLLSQTDYNEIGQVLTKHQYYTGSSFLQDIGYTYNERGWLKTSGSSLFAMQLDYNDGTYPQYNGNITNQLWGTPGSLTKSFTYTYDALNRLTAGTSSEGYTESSISYDNLGNIAGLTRAGTGYTYNYSGNQLSSVTGLTGSYSYDGNGNVSYDGRTGETVYYNLLNLPRAESGSPSINYTYDATGNKLSKYNGTTTTEYIDGIQYDNGTLSFVQTEEGRAINGGTYSYDLNLSDHLGNTRLTYVNSSGSPSTVQQDDYYPFGLEISRSVTGTKNEYLYNKKELQEETGQYDYGARFYDPVIARWTSIDPMAEMGRRETPYGYTFDNPMRFTDPDGMWPDWGEIGTSIKNTVGLSVALAYNMMTIGVPEQTQKRVIRAIDNTNKTLGIPTVSGVVDTYNGVATPEEKLQLKSSIFSTIEGGLFPGGEGEGGAFGTKLKIEIPDEGKIGRELLDPPSKHGNAPTFKSDGESVDIHHVGQSPEGPFEERHPNNHRKEGSYKENHTPGKKGLTKTERKEFDKAKTQYWKNEYPKK